LTGLFSLQGAGAGVLLVAPIGEHVKYVIQMHFPRESSTNNTTEYEGLLAGLRIAADLGIKKLIIRGDSQLVIWQVNKNYQSPLMQAYVDEVRKMEERFDGLQMKHIPRAENSTADDLSKCAALKLPVEPGTFVLHLTQPSMVPSMRQEKRRKLNSGQYFPAELPGAAGKDLAGINDKPAGEQQAPAEPYAFTVETNVPLAEEMPLVLAVEP
jgi:ribonuclease HI